MLDKMILEHADAKKWFRNLGIFLAPVAVIYLTQVIGFIQQANGALDVKFLLPTQFSSGAMVLYCFNAAIDYLKKLQTGK